jgi:hypothetical protein
MYAGGAPSLHPLQLAVVFHRTECVAAIIRAVQELAEKEAVKAAGQCSDAAPCLTPLCYSVLVRLRRWAPAPHFLLHLFFTPPPAL